MNPAWSVIFLTTLIGAGQGLFLALFGAELSGYGGTDAERSFLVLGGGVALLLCVGGLISSFFHLGRPERAWRTATMWRSSWLSREVLALPAFMAALFFWSVLHFSGRGGTLALGTLAVLACGALFLCTAMIYASVRFLQEWASPYTVLNYTLLGLASGCTLATALAAWSGAHGLVAAFGKAALLFTAAGFVGRGLSLRRNARLKPKSTLQSAIGIRHPQIRQRAMGFMGGSFNTREFFHGRSAGALRQVKTAFLLGAFVLPLGLLALGLASASAGLLALAFVVQYAGLLAERWFFFAQANHPQNLYYQAVS